MLFLFCVFFFFKQKTAYEMRISDWSSDVCSSDLPLGRSSVEELSPRYFSGPVCSGPLRRLRVGGSVIDWPVADPRRAGRSLYGCLALAHYPNHCRYADSSRRPVPLGAAGHGSPARPEERRVGKECVSKCRSRGEPSH